MSLREHFHFQTICPQKALRIPESHSSKGMIILQKLGGLRPSCGSLCNLPLTTLLNLLGLSFPLLLGEQPCLPHPTSWVGMRLKGMKGL